MAATMLCDAGSSSGYPSFDFYLTSMYYLKQIELVTRCMIYSPPQQSCCKIVRIDIANRTYECYTPQIFRPESPISGIPSVYRNYPLRFSYLGTEYIWALSW